MAQTERTEDDAALLAATAAGDGAAFATLYRRHLGPVIGFLMVETRDRELAGDLAAEVFAAALLGAGRYRPEHESALPWLCGIARFKASESRRKGRAEDRARRRLGIPREQLEDEDIARVDELAAAADPLLLKLVEELPTVQRDAIWARVVQERGYGEIAHDLDVSEAAVRQRVSRALAWLRMRTGQEPA